MSIKNFIRSALLGLVLCGSAVSAAPPPEVLLVEQGTHRYYGRLGPVARVAVGDPAVADVSLLKQGAMLITGRSLGTTSLLVWRKAADTPRAFRIRVVPADPALAEASVAPGVGLSGRLPNLLAHRRARQAATAGDAPLADRSEVALETQVLTEVKIAVARIEGPPRRFIEAR